MSAVSTAYVLAAGLGTRLRPLTDERCKPLVEVCGTPLIELTLGLLARAGVRRVGINSHWLHPQLPDALGPSWRGLLALHYTHEPTVLGTGGGLRGLARVLPAPPGEKVLVLNADALIDIDLAAVLAADRKDALATLVLKRVPDVDTYGAIGTDAAGRITDFAGRARTGDVVDRRMFCGVHLVDPRAFDILPPVDVDERGVASGTASGINDEGYPAWMKRGEALYGFDLGDHGTFCDVGTPERLLEANLAVLRGVWSSMHLQPFARFSERAPGVWIAPGALVDPAARLVAPVAVDEGAVIEAGAVVDGSVIGKRARVESGARAVRSVLQSGAVLRTSVVDSVVAPRCVLGPLAPGSLG